MGQVLQFCRHESMGSLQPVERAGNPLRYNPIKPTIRQSVAWMFFEGERSVRQCRRIYRSYGVGERDVEGILREFHRSCVSRALNTGRLRAEMAVIRPAA